MCNKTYSTYMEYLNDIPINHGEAVYITSDVTPLLFSEKKAGRKFTLDKLIQDLKSIFNKDNTILIPEFNWDFCQIGIGKMTYTPFHFIEEHFFKDIIPYRYMKMFTSEYIDEFGVSRLKGYSMFVRNIELNAVVNSAPFRQEVVDIGIVTQSFIDGVPYYFTHVYEYCNHAKEDIANNKSRKLICYDGRD